MERKRHQWRTGFGGGKPVKMVRAEGLEPTRSKSTGT